MIDVRLEFSFQMKKVVEDLINNNIRSACTNDTLLHLCVSRLNVIKSGYFSDGTSLVVSCMNISSP